MVMQELYKKLKEFGHVRINEPLAKHTTFKIGGPADFFVEIEETSKLVELLNYLMGEGIEFYIIGEGSNLLINDEGFRGVVINIRDTRYEIRDNTIEACAGVLLSAIVSATIQNSFTGFEWAAGVPGTVGGAVRGNAGAYGGSTSDNLVKIEIWENGEVREISKEECGFFYRNSMFKNNPGIVILRAWFEFKPGDKKAILALVQEHMQARSARFPRYPSAGCFFTNIKIEKWSSDKSVLPKEFLERGGVPAGWLVEQAGCKGLKIGGAMVSEQHCNFIINVDNATQNDVLAIVEEIKEKVYNKFGIELEQEVEIKK